MKWPLWLHQVWYQVEGDNAEEAAAHKQQPVAWRAGVADGRRAAKDGERWVGTVLRGGRAAAGVAVEG